jgi:hypothetical protein
MENTFVIWHTSPIKVCAFVNHKKAATHALMGTDEELIVVDIELLKPIHSVSLTKEPLPLIKPVSLTQISESSDEYLFLLQSRNGWMLVVSVNLNQPAIEIRNQYRIEYEGFCRIAFLTNTNEKPE